MQPLSLAEATQLSFPETETINSIDEVILSGSIYKSGKLLKSLLSVLANDPQDQRWLTLILSGEQADSTIKWLKTNDLSIYSKTDILRKKPHLKPIFQSHEYFTC